MAKNKNQYGLVRDIAADVQKTVRERCGYGCVVCGGLIYQYHHNQIEFHAAKQHDPDYLMLLCPTCHACAGQSISHDRLSKWVEKPFCKRKEFGKIENFLMPADTVNFRFGKSYIKNCPVILQIEGQPVIWVDPPEEDGAPCRLSAQFCFQGESFAQIDANYLRVTTKPGWEIRSDARCLRVRYLGRMVLSLSRLDDDITLVDMKLQYPNGYAISVNPQTKQLAIRTPQSSATIGVLQSSSNGAAIRLHPGGFSL